MNINRIVSLVQYKKYHQHVHESCTDLLNAVSFVMIFTKLDDWRIPNHDLKNAEFCL